MNGLTKKEIAELSTLIANASMDDLRTVANLYNYRQDELSREARYALRLGDKVKWKNSKTGRTIVGKVKKIKRKNIEVITEFDGTWNVTATLLEKV